LLPPWLIWVGATIRVVDLLMSFRKVALGFFRLFLRIGHSGRLEHLICETLESVIVQGLVLSLVVENADAIQEAFKFTRSGLRLHVVSWLFHHVDRMIHFPLFGMS
jgi:hypothetical protein